MFPDDLRWPLAGWVNRLVEWLVANHGDAFEAALDLMNRDGANYAYAVDAAGKFAGVVTRDDAARLREVPTLKPDVRLEDLLAVVADAEWPVPVVNEASTLVGVISGTDILAALAGTDD